ncbi:MAG TPA: type II CAAX endopeptidase family protein [Puia sp.]|nr:type II CAAX endopeptidase family protein [Puia sp.]
MFTNKISSYCYLAKPCPLLLNKIQIYTLIVDMKSYLRIQSPGMQLVLFMGLLLAGFVLSSLIAAIFLVANGSVTLGQKSFDFSDPKLVNAFKSVQAFYTIAAFLLPAIIFGLVTFRYKSLYFLGFRNPTKFNFYLFAIALMFVSVPFASWLGQLNEHIPLAKWMIDTEKDAEQQMTAFLKTNSSKDVVINILVIALIPAICEEACFRGALQRIMINIFKSPWMGIVITSILFSAFHMEFAGFLPRMFLGILLGALYWYSGSLWVCIAAHFFNNGAELIAILYYPKLATENPSVPIYFAVASGLLVWGILYFVKKQSKMSYNTVYEFEELNDQNGFLT